jgi:hypothetical protein
MRPPFSPLRAVPDGRGARLPEARRPQDLESALAIQARTVAVLGQTVGGWKCSLPPAPAE